jgi:hypothetical protein
MARPEGLPGSESANFKTRTANCMVRCLSSAGFIGGQFGNRRQIINQKS